ncbi:toxin-antitoxin system YwqK family antitoxin [Aquimarina brevivitae]|uniref:MORN repeat protein n=1 Tax=Aquimarina brevivitae TaxID=323412 RepID=A0A4Q7PG49_9FLAO|nr:hypothetical protein [Aquimarina brevivitae]RZS99466.1 MORN repeat protein [Aquimarina brevivitae]
MKKVVTLSMMWSLCTCSQTSSEIDTVGQSMIPMSDTYQKAAPVYGNQYFENGKKKPYTGILYGKYDNGQLMTLQEYTDGIGNGTWVQFNPDGTKQEQGTYKENRVEGPVTQYWEDGSVKAKGYYRHWKQPIGKWTYYDRKGNIVHTMTYTR